MSLKTKGTFSGEKVLYVCLCVSGCLKKMLEYRVLNTRTCESNEFSMRAVKCVSPDRLHG